MNSEAELTFLTHWTALTWSGYWSLVLLTPELRTLTDIAGHLTAEATTRSALVRCPLVSGLRAAWGGGGGGREESYKDDVFIEKVK